MTWEQQMCPHLEATDSRRMLGHTRRDTWARRSTLGPTCSSPTQLDKGKKKYILLWEQRHTLKEQQLPQDSPVGSPHMPIKRPVFRMGC
jgi:hypothetical protein